MMDRRLLSLFMSIAPVLIVPGGQLRGQTTPEEPAEVTPAAQLSAREALEKALEAIAAAEKGGPDAALNLQQASQLANYVLAISPGDPQAGFVIGRAILLEGRTREAMSYLTAYTKTREGQLDWLGFKLLGDILSQGKYYELAQANYKQALELNKNKPEIYLGLAGVQLARKMYGEAAKHAEKAIDLDPEPNPHAHAFRAHILLEGVRDEYTPPQEKEKSLRDAEPAAAQAVEATKEEISRHPGDTQLLNDLNQRYALMLGILQEKLGMYPEQVEIYLKISALIQDQANLARLIAYHHALQLLERGIEATAPETSPELLWETARLQYAVARNEDALKTLDALLEKNPEHAQGKRLREKVSRELSQP